MPVEKLTSNLNANEQQARRSLNKSHEAIFCALPTKSRSDILTKPESGRVSFWLLFLLLLLASLITFGTIAWKRYYPRWAETTPPVIKVIGNPRGIGLNQNDLKLSVSDPDSGLDEIVVRLRQRGRMRELLRKECTGQKEELISVPLPYDKERYGLEEGNAEIEIKAFDRSFFSNAAQEKVLLIVDFRRPKLEVITTQHNARKGGSQLLAYRTSDDNLALSGVRVGDNSFVGVPLENLDKDFTDSDLYAVVYAVDQRRPVSDKEVLAFSEDRAGNTSQLPFYNHISQRSERGVATKLNDEFVERNIPALAERGFPVMSQRARSLGYELHYASTPGSAQHLIEQFQLVNTLYRDDSEERLKELLHGSRPQAYWTKSFSFPRGTVLNSYDDRLRFSYKNINLGDALETGYEIVPPGDGRDVSAASRGFVVYADDLGTFGRLVVIDHGTGIVSLYGHLAQIFVKRGQEVQQGETIGTIGETGFSRGVSLYFGMRVQGVPVDPLEWCDQDWFAAHITGKIQELKKTLGIAVYRPLFIPSDE